MFWKLLFAMLVFLCSVRKGVTQPDGTTETIVEHTTPQNEIEYRTAMVLDPTTGGFVFDSNKTIGLCNTAHLCSSDGCQSSTTACNCDQYCHFFNDCCKDVSSCEETSPPDDYPGLVELGIGTESIGCITPVLSSFPPDYSYYAYSEGASVPGVYMIDKCIDVRSEFVQKCHEYNATDIQSSIPTTETTYGISFKNVYCALCNKISLNNIHWWKLLAKCDEDILPLIEDGLRHGVSLAETLQVINNFCPISFQPSDSFTSQIGSRQCYPNLADYDSCALNALPELTNRCDDYTAYVTDIDGKIYRNADCFLCSNSNLLNDSAIQLDCYDGDIPLIWYKRNNDDDYYVDDDIPGFVPPENDLRPISVIVDFTSDSGVSVQVSDTVIIIEKVSCLRGQVYDPFIDQCRTLSCSKGFTLIGDECVSNGKDCSKSLQLAITLSYANCGNETSEIAAAKQCIERSFIPTGFDMLSTKHDCSNIGGKNIGHLTFEIKSKAAFATLVDIEQTFDDIFVTQGNSMNTCSTSEITLNITCLPEDSECDDKLSLSNVSIEYSENVTFITSRSTRYLFSEGSLSIHYVLLGEGIKTIHADICDTIHFSCTLVTLNASLFTNVSNNALLYQPTGALFMNDEYIFTPDGEIQVCSFLDTNGTRNTTQVITFLAYDNVQIILSLIGCILSLIALLGTFVTFCVFSHLRTRAIKAIMNLVAALFTAQLLFLIGAGRTSNTNICTIIAVLLHYLWLCTFTWSYVLAYDLSITFSSMTYQERNTPILRYLCYGWFTPIAIVVPCLVIQLCNCSDVLFQYGNEGVCWIYNQYANLVAFGVPLVLCLAINLVLFTKTAWNIHSTKKNTKMVQQKQSRLKNVCAELLIYVKIATLMGFTWIFAFSAAFTGVSALWYIYIIINSLQGLYIFFAFTFNVRIGRLWAKKLSLSYFDDSGVESDQRKAKKRTQSSFLQGSECNVLTQKEGDEHDDNKGDVSVV